MNFICLILLFVGKLSWVSTTDCQRLKDNRLPLWPSEFQWSPAGPVAGHTCIAINEPSDPHTWSDNFLCWRSERKDPGFKWSYDDPIKGMRCTSLNEPSDKDSWHDNYLCVPKYSPYQFTWKTSKTNIDPNHCIYFHEAADPDTWNDNFLCDDYRPLPVWPNDFAFSSKNQPKGYDCISVNEPSDHDHWKDNYFCWKNSRRNPGFKWSYDDAITGMRCTNTKEPSDKNAWDDNFICVPETAPYNLVWSFGAPLPVAKSQCIQWLETSDPHAWNDNYLCNKPSSLQDYYSSLKVKDEGSCQITCLKDGNCWTFTWDPNRQFNPSFNCYLFLKDKFSHTIGFAPVGSYTYSCRDYTDNELARRWAPLVYMHHDEQYFPSSVDFFLDKVILKGAKSPPPNLLTTSNLPKCDGPKEKCFLFTKERLHDPSSTIGMFKGQDVNTAPAYAFYHPQKGNIIDISYFFFYPYNRGKNVCVGARIFGKCIGKHSTFGNHVGDWEHVTIRFKNRREPYSIFLSVHDSAITKKYGGQKLWNGESFGDLQMSGSHAVVFSAKGSHGVWPHPGKHSYKKLPNGDHLYDECSVGPPWNTWVNLKIINSKKDGGYIGANSWVHYNGRWGRTPWNCPKIIGQCVLDTGPTGPQQKGFMSNGSLG